MKSATYSAKVDFVYLNFKLWHNLSDGNKIEYYLSSVNLGQYSNKLIFIAHNFHEKRS